MYSIGEVAKMFNLPISTLRYYDKEGLFPNLGRTSGIRRFDDRTVETIRIIECLKKSGMEIKEIKQFIEWCGEGPATYAKRREMFTRRRQAVEEEIERLQGVLDMIEYKSWYYDTAIADGNEQRAQALTPEGLPEDIRAAYERSHKAYSK